MYFMYFNRFSIIVTFLLIFFLKIIYTFLTSVYINVIAKYSFRNPRIRESFLYKEKMISSIVSAKYKGKNVF